MISVIHLSRGVPEPQWAQARPRVTPGTSCTAGERAQMILVWVRAPSIEIASHPYRLRVKWVRPWAWSSLWCPNSIILKITSNNVEARTPHKILEVFKGEAEWPADPHGSNLAPMFWLVVVLFWQHDYQLNSGLLWTEIHIHMLLP